MEHIKEIPAWMKVIKQQNEEISGETDTTNTAKVTTRKIYISSSFLGKDMLVKLYLPPNFKDGDFKVYPLLLFNDGQEMEAIHLKQTLERFYESDEMLPIVVAGLFPQNRMGEYGTAGTLDYKGRGQLAEKYTQFIIEELLPHLQENYQTTAQAELRAFAGFSLGGLSAMDIVWKRSHYFGQVGVFSGSLWWRSKASTLEDPDANRIMHDTLLESDFVGKRHLKFWFQAGTKDEEEDRNNNGVIDAIDDTLHVVGILKWKGFEDDAIQYVEVTDGKHHPSTWKEVLPNFLLWAFGY